MSIISVSILKSFWILRTIYLSWFFLISFVCLSERKKIVLEPHQKDLGLFRQKMQVSWNDYSCLSRKRSNKTLLICNMGQADAKELTIGGENVPTRRLDNGPDDRREEKGSRIIPLSTTPKPRSQDDFDMGLAKSNLSERLRLSRQVRFGRRVHFARDLLLLGGTILS